MTALSFGSTFSRCSQAFSNRFSVVISFPLTWSKDSASCDGSDTWLGYATKREPPGVCSGALVACGFTFRRRRDGVVAVSGVEGGLLAAIRLAVEGVGVVGGCCDVDVVAVFLRLLVGVEGTLGTAKRASSRACSFDISSAADPNRDLDLDEVEADFRFLDFDEIDADSFIAPSAAPRVLSTAVSVSLGPLAANLALLRRDDMARGETVRARRKTLG
jgi:hypothetical protein